jgi:hypothetical protein
LLFTISWIQDYSNQNLDKIWNLVFIYLPRLSSGIFWFYFDEDEGKQHQTKLQTIKMREHAQDIEDAYSSILLWDATFLLNISTGNLYPQWYEICKAVKPRVRVDVKFGEPDELGESDQ